MSNENKLLIGNTTIYPAFGTFLVHLYLDGDTWSLVADTGDTRARPSHTFEISSGDVRLFGRYTVLDSPGTIQLWEGHDHRICAVVMTSKKFDETLARLI